MCTRSEERNGSFTIELVPFDIPYTEQVQDFIVDGASGSYDKWSYFTLFVYNIINRKKKPPFSYECDKEPNPFVPGTFQPTESSKRDCRWKCITLNLQYLIFLREATLRAMKKIFPNETSRYDITFYNPITEMESNCIYCEKEEIFECSCVVTRYRILVSTFLKNAVERAVFSYAHFLPKRDIEMEFFTFILLLKFHPQAAPLYLTYLAYKYDLHLEILTTLPFDLESDLFLNTEVSIEDLNERILAETNLTEASFTETSLTEDKGPILRNEDEIFQRILEGMHSGFCSLKLYGSLYFNDSITLRIIIEFFSTVFQIFHYMFNTFADKIHKKRE